jgi:hypothetical protein
MPSDLRVRAAVAVTGGALTVAAAAGLPLAAATAPLALGTAALARTVARARGGGAVALLAVLSLAACAVVPGSTLGAWQGLAVAVTLAAYLCALEVQETRSRLPAATREAAGAVVAAAALAALFLLPSAAAVWLVPVGLATLVACFAAAVSGTGRRP